MKFVDIVPENRAKIQFEFFFHFFLDHHLERLLLIKIQYWQKSIFGYDDDDDDDDGCGRTFEILNGRQ